MNTQRLLIGRFTDSMPNSLEEFESGQWAVESYRRDKLPLLAQEQFELEKYYAEEKVGQPAQAITYFVVLVSSDYWDKVHKGNLLKNDKFQSYSLNQDDIQFQVVAILLLDSKGYLSKEVYSKTKEIQSSCEHIRKMIRRLPEVNLLQDEIAELQKKNQELEARCVLVTEENEKLVSARDSHFAIYDVLKAEKKSLEETYNALIVNLSDDDTSAVDSNTSGWPVSDEAEEIQEIPHASSDSLKLINVTSAIMTVILGAGMITSLVIGASPVLSVLMGLGMTVGISSAAWQAHTILREQENFFTPKIGGMSWMNQAVSRVQQFFKPEPKLISSKSSPQPEPSSGARP